MLGRPAFAEDIGSQRTEWLVRARTDGGLEGLTVANRFMQQFHGFDSSDGTVRGLISLLREGFLGRTVDEFLKVSDGQVVGVRDAYKQAFWAHGWMSILAFDLLGQEMGVSCVELLGGQVRDRVPAYDTTLFFQDLLNPEKGAAQVAADAAKSHSDGYNGFKIKVGRPGRWMTPEAGVERDAEVVLAVRGSSLRPPMGASSWAILGPAVLRQSGSGRRRGSEGLTSLVRTELEQRGAAAWTGPIALPGHR